MSTLKVSNIKHASSGSNNIVLNSNGTVTFPNNENIIQVVQTHKTDTSVYYNVDANSYTPNFISRSITMSSSSNKALVIANVAVGLDSNHQPYPIIRRGSTDIFIGDSSFGGSRQRVGSTGPIYDNNIPMTYTMVFLDEPSTNGSVTYNVYSRHSDNGNRHVYINRGDTNNNEYYYPNCSSSLIVCEVSS